MLSEFFWLQSHSHSKIITNSHQGDRQTTMQSKPLKFVLQKIKKNKNTIRRNILSYREQSYIRKCGSYHPYIYMYVCTVRTVHCTVLPPFREHIWSRGCFHIKKFHNTDVPCFFHIKELSSGGRDVSTQNVSRKSPVNACCV